MNKSIYRLVWNHSLGALQVVSELAKGKPCGSSVAASGPLQRRSVHAAGPLALLALSISAGAFAVPLDTAVTTGAASGTGSISDILGAQNDNSASYAAIAANLGTLDLSAMPTLNTYTQISASSGTVSLINGALTGALRSSAIAYGNSLIPGGALSLIGNITASSAGVFTGAAGGAGSAGSNGAYSSTTSDAGEAGTSGTVGNAGGAAIYAQLATLSNSATLTGGSAGTGGTGGTGGSGYSNYVVDSTDGGTGGGGGAGGTGGTGLVGIASTLHNSGNVTAGAGGNGGSGNNGGQGGNLYSYTNTTVSASAGSGGAGGAGGNAGNGGIGISLNDSTLANTGAVAGGASGIGGNGSTGGTGGYYYSDYGYSATSNTLYASGDGGAGGAGGSGGAGGAALLASNSVITNSGVFSGGAGLSGGLGGSGGMTGWAEDDDYYNLSTSFDTTLASAIAGAGGTGGTGGNGGTAIDATGSQITNNGTLLGGAAGSGAAGGAGGDSDYTYTDIERYSTQGTTTRVTTGTGGAGGSGGMGGLGGTGVVLAASRLSSTQSITGGSGGAGGNGGNAGSGGYGYLYFFGQSSSNDLFTVATGDGGAGGQGGNGGNGGSGVIASASTVINSASITGGNGGDGGNGGTGGISGSGYVYGYQAYSSTISGTSGNGGNGGGGGNGGDGGAGIVASASQIFNTGTISGGNGGIAGIAGTPGVPGNLSSYGLGTVVAGSPGLNGMDGTAGLGGVGVIGNGGTTLYNAGTIAGGFANAGNGAQANAVEFYNGGNTLVLEQGSVIQGQVVSMNGGDTLSLGGDTSVSGGNVFDLASVGATAQYQGFSTYSKVGLSTWLLQGIDSLGETWNVNAGTLILDQGSALAGDVNINAGTFVLSQNSNVAGTLTVAAGASLASATASIGTALINQGNLSLGAGSNASNTLTTGSYTQSSSATLTVRALSSTVFDKLVVNGTATLGGTLAVDASTGNSLAIGNSLSPVISATAINGQFAAVTDNSLLFNFTPVYSANTVGLQVVAAATVTPVTPTTPLTTVASLQANSNFHGLNAARVLDRTFASNANGRLASFFVPLTTSAAVSRAVTESLPTPGASTSAASTAMNSINQVIQARSEAVRGLASGESFMTDGHLWLKPFGSWARQDGSNGSPDLKASVGGLAVGVDGKRSEYLTLGTALIYANVNSHTTGDAPHQTLDTDVFQLVGYGSYQLDPITALNVQVDAGQNRNAGKRDIDFAGVQAKSHYSSWTAHAGTSLERTYTLTPQTRVTPSVRADYSWIKDDAYDEKGADALNLQANKRHTDSFIVGVDGKLAHDLSDKVTLSLNAGVGYDALADRDSITTTYAGAPGAAFTTYGNEAQHWVGRGGAGVVYKVNDRVNLGVRYDVEARKNFSNQTAAAEVRWAF